MDNLNFLTNPKNKDPTSKLKLKMNFCDKGLNDQIQKENEESVRKQSIKDYEFIKILGQGAFAKVVEVRNRLDGKLYAMKIIHKSKIMMNSEENTALTTEENVGRNMYRIRQIQSEKNIFKLLNQHPSPFTVKLHSAFTSTNYLFMVLDLCPGGDLFNLIQRHKKF